jgi:hypothetical protein
MADTVSTVVDALSEAWDDFVFNLKCVVTCQMPGDGSLDSVLAGLPPVLEIPSAGLSTLRTVGGGVEASVGFVQAAKDGGGSGGQAIALGLSSTVTHAPGILERFADKVGAAGWWDWHRLGLTKVNWLPGDSAAKFKKMFMSVLPKASSIKFNLSAITFDGLSVGSTRFEKGQWTVAELMIIVNDPALLSKTVFYRNGKEVPTPQVLAELGL